MDYQKELDESCKAFRKAMRNAENTSPDVITRKGNTLYVVNRARQSEACITLNYDGIISGRRIG